jgi:hypothetical protein
MKIEITRNEYLQLVGLKTIAMMYYRRMKDVEEAVIAITGEEDKHGHACDFVWDENITVDALLEKMEITVFLQEPARMGQR